MTYDNEDKLIQLIHDLENKIDELEFELQDAKEDARFWHEEYDKLRMIMEKEKDL